MGTNQSALGSLPPARPACPSHTFQPFGLPLWGTTFLNFCSCHKFYNFLKIFIVIIFIFSCLEVFVHVLDASPQRLQSSSPGPSPPVNFVFGSLQATETLYFDMVEPVASLLAAVSQTHLTPSACLHFPLRLSS